MSLVNFVLARIVTTSFVVLVLSIAFGETGHVDKINTAAGAAIGAGIALAAMRLRGVP